MLIDTDYNGKHFRIVKNVRPEKRNGFINAEYELTLQPISIIAIGVDTDGYCRILGGGESKKVSGYGFVKWNGQRGKN